MRANIVSRARWLVIGVLFPLTILTLWAQEPRTENRGITSLQGNIVAARGYVNSGAGVVRDFRTNTSVTGTSPTYTAAQVLTGYITRSALVQASTDVMPTAANLAAAIPGLVAGHSFWLMVDTASPLAAITLNGASTGVTYADGCSTTITTNDAMLVLINFTSTSAYRVVCVNVNT